MMSPKAVALLRPKSVAKLAEHLGADEVRHVEMLYDGAVLYHTGIKYAPMTFDALIARAWLTGFGEDLALVHDDPRGVLFFPDSLNVYGGTYEEIAKEVGYAGIWVAASTLSADEQYEQHVALTWDIRRLSSAPPRF